MRDIIQQTAVARTIVGPNEGIIPVPGLTTIGRNQYCKLIIGRSSYRGGSGTCRTIILRPCSLKGKRCCFIRLQIEADVRRNQPILTIGTIYIQYHVRILHTINDDVGIVGPTAGSRGQSRITTNKDIAEQTISTRPTCRNISGRNYRIVRNTSLRLKRIEVFSRKGIRSANCLNRIIIHSLRIKLGNAHTIRNSTGS